MRIFSTRSSTHVLFDYYYIRKIVVKNGRWRGHHRRIREFHQRWQRFPSTLQMKPVPFYDGISDGRSSFGFSWSLLSSSLLSLSLCLLFCPPLCRPAPSLKPVVFFTNTQHRRTKEALYLGKRWEPETFCYIVSIYRYPFRENCRVTGEFVARIDNRRTLRKIRLKRVIRGSKLSVVVLNLVSSCWKSFLSFLFLYSVIIHSRSFAFFVVYLFPVSGSKVKLKI